MVDQSPTHAATAAERPFALRSTLFTIGFLVLSLGVIPALFHLAGTRLAPSSGGATTLAQFGRELCALIGAAIFSIGLACYVFCSFWLIFFGRGPHVEFDPPKALVTTGPYRWIRNPVLISLLVTWTGLAIYFASIGLAALVGLAVAFAYCQVAKIEEPRLRRRFGQSYEDYCRSVPRWLPRPPRD